MQAQDTIPARIDALRARLRAHGLSAWIVLSSDPHLSEYLPARWQTRQWLSGFTGSAGTLVVTEDRAALLVDSRYWVDAERQLAGTGIETVKAAGSTGAPLTDWLRAHVPEGTAVGVDGMTIGLALARAIETALQGRDARLRTDLDLTDEIWPDRPPLPADAVHERNTQFESRSRAHKLALIRERMQACGADRHWISSLDDIAWLFNLRGSDIPFNPVFLAHALIERDGATLFLAPGKVDAALEQRLRADGVELAEYGRARSALAAVGPGEAVLLDPRRVTAAMARALGQGVRIIEQINPSVLIKSRKSAEELWHVRAAMEQDGAALCEFFAWLDDAVARRERITECTIDERLSAERARRPGFVSLSFETIAGFNANGASPHYRATAEAHAVICDGTVCGEGLLLIDSGGQYEGGTTDITRVVAIGRPTPEQRRDFTLVLKGMIQLSTARFPHGHRAPLLDSLARAPLWAHGLDYGHGTGHGVGYFLNVHEGPQSISPSAPPEPHTAMEVGMITSNEPGVYRPGKWGVRIENLLATVPAPQREGGAFGEFLQFETLTLCPIDRRCIDRNLLRADEIAWLDAYHATVRRRLEPLLGGAARKWLIAATRAI